MGKRYMSLDHMIRTFWPGAQTLNVTLCGIHHATKLTRLPAISIWVMSLCTRPLPKGKGKYMWVWYELISFKTVLTGSGSPPSLHVKLPCNRHHRLKNVRMKFLLSYALLWQQQQDICESARMHGVRTHREQCCHLKYMRPSYIMLVSYCLLGTYCTLFVVYPLGLIGNTLSC